MFLMRILDPMLSCHCPFLPNARHKVFINYDVCQDHVRLGIARDMASDYYGSSEDDDQRTIAPLLYVFEAS